MKNTKNKLIVFKNQDKDSFMEKWFDGRNMANIPHSFRMCMIGPPNRGKSNYTKNILIKQKPEFERIMIWTNSKTSQEYDNCEAEIFENCPTEEDILKDVDEKTGQPPKQIVIIEDVELEGLDKTDTTNLLKLLKHFSSHFNTSVIINVQDLIQIPASMRRCCSVFVLWRMSNGTMRILGERFNIENRLLYNMAQAELRDYHDSIMIDLTKKSPYKYRRNLYELLDENNYIEKSKIMSIPIFKIKK
jgi:hypothetical protein